MGRSNVIIVGSVALAPLVLGIESYALYRAHHRRVQTLEIAGSTEMTAPPVAPAPPVPVPAERPFDPPPPPAAAAAEAPPSEAEPATASEIQPDPSAERPRQMMLQRRGEILQAADEKAFGVLNVPDAQRDAIRAIDSAYVRQRQAAGQLPPGADLPSAGLDPNGERKRRAAIANILGEDSARAFTFAEKRAERRLRSQSRAEQVPSP